VDLHEVARPAPICRRAVDHDHVTSLGNAPDRVLQGNPGERQRHEILAARMDRDLKAGLLADGVEKIGQESVARLDGHEPFVQRDARGRRRGRRSNCRR
jgi:hypothetical protein